MKPATPPTKPAPHPSADRASTAAPNAVLVIAVTAMLLAGMTAGWYGPMAGGDAALLQIPTLVPVALLVVAARRHWIDTAGFLCAVAFLGLHTLASYYGYCNVPYDDWLEALGGTRTAALLESDRNHYDRLMHFTYGLLLVLPVRQSAAKLLGVRGVAATWIAVEFLLATSALYEVGEWLLAVVMAPEVADRYNGQQGDIWDAQKDMALAAAGAISAAALTFALRSIERFRNGNNVGQDKRQ